MFSFTMSPSGPDACSERRGAGRGLEFAFLCKIGVVRVSFLKLRSAKARFQVGTNIFEFRTVAQYMAFFVHMVHVVALGSGLHSGLRLCFDGHASAVHLSDSMQPQGNISH